MGRRPNGQLNFRGECSSMTTPGVPGSPGSKVSEFPEFPAGILRIIRISRTFRNRNGRGFRPVILVFSVEPKPPAPSRSQRRSLRQSRPLAGNRAGGSSPAWAERALTSHQGAICDSRGVAPTGVQPCQAASVPLALGGTPKRGVAVTPPSRIT